MDFLRRKITRLISLAVCLGLISGIGGPYVVGQVQQTGNVAVKPEAMNGQFAYEMLQKICELGPRISGSQAMTHQQKLLQEYFTELGGTVSLQPFTVRHPVNRTDVQLNNLIVQWHPDRKHRILLCCHYDTRPFPDRDPHNKQGLFLGANDGASGVGLLCELAKYMPQYESGFGVDFVFFDGEEFVYQAQRDPLFLGSTYFARSYADAPPPYRYSAGVLLDMIGDADLNIYYEKNSLRMAPKITKQIWRAAHDQGIKEFIARTRHAIRDDHLPLNEIARIPTCDIIDFDYPKPGSSISYWHTQQDTPDKCSADSLAKVGNVMLAWLRGIKDTR